MLCFLVQLLKPDFLTEIDSFTAIPYSSDSELPLVDAGHLLARKGVLSRS
jgi:hypothetical protein